MNEQDFYADFFDQEGEYIGPKYSCYTYFDEAGDAWTASCKRGDVEDEYPCTSFGPWMPDGSFSPITYAR